MAKYRPSKHFLLAMSGMLPLGIALVTGLLPDLPAIAAPRIPGMLDFPHTRLADQAPSAVQPNLLTRSRKAVDWIEDRHWDLLTWDRNPWKRPGPPGLGEHYFEMLKSKKPADQASLAAIRHWSGPLYRQLQRRYPELAIPLKSVPDDRNGFLKWLELSERVEANPSQDFTFPASLRRDRLVPPWNAAEAKAWQAADKAKIDEARAIGLLSEQSVAGLAIDRYSFISARHARNCVNALLADARLAVQEGDAAAALESVRAARGFADHFDKIETPTLLSTTVFILLNLELQKQALADLIPALPPGKFDPQAWEAAVRPEVVPPSRFARIMKGEWNVTVQQYLLPILCDAGDPHYFDDPEAFIDFYSARFVDAVKAHDRDTMPGWSHVSSPPLRDASRLSRKSRKLAEILFVGEQAWCKGMRRSQYIVAINAAAFAIMKSEPVPKDPIHGLPYIWDPVTRVLSAPSDPIFTEMKVEPLTVPRP